MICPPVIGKMLSINHYIRVMLCRLLSTFEFIVMSSVASSSFFFFFVALKYRSSFLRIPYLLKKICEVMFMVMNHEDV
ncbi:hypothetical protein CARUB_v10019303mg [Capsella rubella]|uniref:Uncharacterized protein n=1 Tax=Capsella rubella TaxID=81985 RepID=R0FL65_9BRAS|nr:hypothetical protein CARUB_v10019303mg [Capsella rubella]